MSRLVAPAIVVAALSLAACKEEAAPPPAVVEAPPPPPVEAAPAKTVIEVPTFTISTAPADIAKGQETFAAKGCVACHKVGGGRLVGPDLKGVLERRDETWVKRMILRPDVMVKEDDVARKLLGEYLTPMPNQGVNPETELPLLLAYLKSAQ